MGYYNPIYVYPVDRFVADAAKAGVDGLIVVDMPPEEDAELRPQASKAGLNFIRLATPTTDAKRLPAVLANTSGFIYYVSIAGITGTKAPDLDDVKGHVGRIKAQTNLPVAVGFGVKSEEQVRAIVGLFREDTPDDDRQMIEQELPLVSRELGAAEGHVHVLDVDRVPLVDVDHGGERIALRGELEVVHDPDVVEAAAPIEPGQAVEIRPERDRIEVGAPAPGGEPGARLARHHVQQIAFANGVCPPEPHAAELPVPCRIERVELDGPSGRRTECRDEHEKAREAPHGVLLVTARTRTATRDRVRS